MPVIAKLRFLVNQTARKLFSMLPQKRRHDVYRSLVDCNPDPNKRLVLKIAESKEELEACFKLLHDAYVSSGFMTPDPSGMRVTIYHALPTTTTLCAKYDDQVVGTLSLIRESAIGFPLQRIFDLTGVREKEGQIAEVSALAVHPRFRRTGGTILFPLMKFMYEYCTTFFDTRHLVIAVNPRHIEMYESLLFFKRLTANVVEKEKRKKRRKHRLMPVSYTHLTLPTICSVQISVVAVSLKKKKKTNESQQLEVIQKQHEKAH
eukprot:TRINITY_DN2839_c0_g1_i2.p1 TRINITY_DN2839_c0_g1~~TRINITY_DN2839_c0_g1_i2.p1  ORF type:complete len:262 (+),score=33.34 TRINITY_DN2839_c0_g1_i2:214-999(+)